MATPSEIEVYGLRIETAEWHWRYAEGFAGKTSDAMARRIEEEIFLQFTHQPFSRG